MIIVKLSFYNFTCNIHTKLNVPLILNEDINMIKF